MQTLGEYLELYGTSVLFVIINALVPNLMFLLLPFEKYDSGKTEFNVTITRYVCGCYGILLPGSMFLCRVFLVRIFNLYALMAGWLIATEVFCLSVCLSLSACMYVYVYVCVHPYMERIHTSKMYSMYNTQYCLMYTVQLVYDILLLGCYRSVN